MSIKRAFEVLLALILVARGLTATVDPDLWWHLRTGALVWESGIPAQDVFSHTRPGAPWVAHEWLADALMWLVASSVGLAALDVLFALIAALAFLLAYSCSPGRPYLAGAVTALASFSAASSLGARPQVVNLLFLAIFVLVLERVRSGKLALNGLLILPVLTVAWVNLHSGFLLGIAVLLACAAGEIAEHILTPGAVRSTGEPEADRGRIRWLLGTAIACFIAALANPYGWHMWGFAPSTLGSDLIQGNIVEWLSPDFHQPMYWPFAALLFVGTASWAVGPRRPSGLDVLLFLGTAAAGLVSRRHIALFAIVAIPVVARSLHENLRDRRLYAELHDRTPRAIPGVASVLNWMLVVVGVAGLLAWSEPKLAGKDAAIAAQFPVAAVDFVEREGLAAKPVFNAYGWGGYLIWRGIRPFVDGRAEVYGDFLGDYLTTFRLSENWREPLERFDVEYVLVERNSSLVTLLVASGDWRIAFDDPVAAVLVRTPVR